MTKLKDIADKLINFTSHDGKKPPTLLKCNSIYHKSNDFSIIIPDRSHADAMHEFRIFPIFPLKI